MLSTEEFLLTGLVLHYTLYTKTVIRTLLADEVDITRTGGPLNMPQVFLLNLIKNTKDTISQKIFSLQKIIDLQTNFRSPKRKKSPNN